MACGATPHLDLMEQIQNARDNAHSNFARLISITKELEHKLLQEIENLEHAHRQYTKGNFSNFHTSTLSTIEKVSNVFVPDCISSIERTLRKTLSNITVNKYRDIDKPDRSSSSRGDGEGKLDSPRGVAIDPNTDDIYVADTSNDRIQVYDWKARCTREFSNSYLSGPKGICVSESENRIFVTANSDNMVQSYRKDGSFVKEIDSYHSYQFNDPIGIAADQCCKVYVCDRRNDKVVVFDKGLHFITVLTKRLSRPRDVKLRNNQVIILSDSNNNCIHFYTPGGDFLRTLIESGHKDYQVSCAYFFDIDSRGNILITDTDNNCIKVFNTEGCYICDIGAKGEEKGDFKYPTGIAVDIADDSFVTICDRKAKQLQIFFP